MIDAAGPSDNQLQAEIDALRAANPDTQDLYREVCVLLFFRYGITPTANKLYQLVRKGSMNAPAEALSRFWSTLREKSRVRIEHPDIPEPLRDAAGEVVAALWRQAQAAATADLAAAREEARQAAVDAKDSLDRAIEAHNTAIQKANAELHRAHEEMTALHNEMGQLREERDQGMRELATLQGKLPEMEKALAVATAQVKQMQRDAVTTAETHHRQIESQRLEAAQQLRAATERHDADQKRVLLDLDRERTQVGLLKKEMEQLRAAAQREFEQELHLRQTLEQRLRGSQEQAARLTGEVDALKVQKGEYFETVQALQERIEQLVKELTRAQAQPSKAKSKRAGPSVQQPE